MSLLSERVMSLPVLLALYTCLTYTQLQLLLLTISALFVSGRQVPRSIATVNTDDVVTMAIRMTSNTLKLQ